MLLVLHNVTMASLRTFARKVAADDETWRNNNQTWARANFSFFIYFLFQIKWHFDFFFTEKWGVDIHPIHPPLYPPLRSYIYIYIYIGQKLRLLVYKLYAFHPFLVNLKSFWRLHVRPSCAANSVVIKQDTQVKYSQIHKIQLTG